MTLLVSAPSFTSATLITNDADVASEPTTLRTRRQRLASATAMLNQLGTRLRPSPMPVRMIVFVAILVATLGRVPRQQEQLGVLFPAPKD